MIQIQLHPTAIHPTAISVMPSSLRVLTQQELLKQKKEEQRFVYVQASAALEGKHRRGATGGQRESPLGSRAVPGQLREHARDRRARQFAAEHGPEAYAAKQEKSRLKQLEKEARARRAVRPKVPRGQGQKTRRPPILPRDPRDEENFDLR
ncbi:hypothetical protein C8F04DRAFT_1278924 [Mycena alexandri]|uniref:Uncharacterized protein n=1 Tax=Mycena alexandri TaxID=1745969 RepID=A0AAD6S2L1_9AGAR|nr:hypothetical protein C8F04DRAFT_1278924 [Mycena alexandri]